MDSRGPPPDGPWTIGRAKLERWGRDLKWRRDLLDRSADVNVRCLPGRMKSSPISIFLRPRRSRKAISAGSSATEKLAVISWNQVLLYPKGWKSDDITFSASLKIPDGWKYATSLNMVTASGNDLHFAPCL